RGSRPIARRAASWRRGSPPASALLPSGNRSSRFKSAGLTANTSALRVPLVPARASPRPLHLLRPVGPEPHPGAPPPGHESPPQGETPRQLALRLALAKAAAAAAPDAYVIGADTVVALGLRVFGKPEDEAEARRMLAKLSGRSHKVLTGVAVRAPDGRV